MLSTRRRLHSSMRSPLKMLSDSPLADLTKKRAIATWPKGCLRRLLNSMDRLQSSLKLQLKRALSRQAKTRLKPSNLTTKAIQLNIITILTMHLALIWTTTAQPAHTTPLTATWKNKKRQAPHMSMLSRSRKSRLKWASAMVPILMDRAPLIIWSIITNYIRVSRSYLEVMDMNRRSAHQNRRKAHKSRT